MHLTAHMQLYSRSSRSTGGNSSGLAAISSHYSPNPSLAKGTKPERSALVAQAKARLHQQFGLEDSVVGEAVVAPLQRLSFDSTDIVGTATNATEGYAVCFSHVVDGTVVDGDTFGVTLKTEGSEYMWARRTVLNKQGQKKSIRHAKALLVRHASMIARRLDATNKPIKIHDLSLRYIRTANGSVLPAWCLRADDMAFCLDAETGMILKAEIPDTNARKVPLTEKVSE